MPPIVRTASEFKRMVREKDHDAISKTEIITCAMMSVVESVSTEFSIHVPEEIPPGFVDSIRMNGLSVTPDMVRDDHLDCMILGETERDDGYGTGHLYRDIVSGNPIDVEAIIGDRVYRFNATIDDMSKATMTALYDTLTSMRAYVNDGPKRRPCLYSAPNGLDGNRSECSVIGCGEIEPLFNHRNGSIFKVGDLALLNGSKGKVIRASDDESDDIRYVQISADMHHMDPYFMGGFSSPYGPMNVVSVATAIRLENGDLNRELVVSDCGVPLPISYRDNTESKFWDSYGNVWSDNYDVIADLTKCIHCDECTADSNCPMGAHPSTIADVGLCLSCGSCIGNCEGGVFSGSLGRICVDGEIVPVSIRLSSRKKAEELCEILKQRIRDGGWYD